jgi:hypothetical protein
VADGKFVRRLEPCSKDATSAPRARHGLVDRPSAYPSAVALTSDGAVLAAACSNEVAWFDVHTGARLGSLPATEERTVGQLAIVGTRSALRLLTFELDLRNTSAPAVARLRDASDGAAAWTLPLGPSHANLGLSGDLRWPWTRSAHFALSPEADRLLIAGNDLCLWSMTTGEQIRCLDSPGGAHVIASAWSPDGAFVLGADEPASALYGQPPPPGPPPGIHLWPRESLRTP